MHPGANGEAEIRRSESLVRCGGRAGNVQAIVEGNKKASPLARAS